PRAGKTALISERHGYLQRRERSSGASANGRGRGAPAAAGMPHAGRPAYLPEREKTWRCRRGGRWHGPVPRGETRLPERAYSSYALRELRRTPSSGASATRPAWA